MINSLYNIYSKHLIQKYGQKVYKLPINIPSSCPNRDGRKDFRGCIFCGASGAGHELRNLELSVNEQLRQNRDLIEKKYKAHKFIAYFQSFSNTYLEFEDFKKYILEAVNFPDIVEVAISTRPDCIEAKHLNFLKQVKEEYGVEITIELGLQTSNNSTLEILNRHHSVEDYILASNLIKDYGFNLCTHVISDLPWDSEIDIINLAKLLNETRIDYLKIHSLYVEKDTELERLYLEGLELLECEDFINRTILLLENLDPNIVIERLIGRVPESDSVVANWHKSWWKVKDELENEMKNRKVYQGYNYNKNE